MLTITNLKWKIPEKAQTDHVHLFYKDSIKHLFGIDINEKCLSPTRNRKNLVSMLRSILCNEVEYSYFLDIRLQEELGSPSPQYEILKDLGLVSVTPICVQGDKTDIIKHGILLMESVLSANERAICSVSILSSAKWQYNGPEFMIVFELLSDGVTDGTIRITERI